MYVSSDVAMPRMGGVEALASLANAGPHVILLTAAFVVLVGVKAPGVTALDSRDWELLASVFTPDGSSGWPTMGTITACGRTTTGSRAASTS